ncbi:DNA-binding XRE family transcriptional regulator [Tumebacillus sp. BK434]|uniref:helix-turn-helix domain-containing protein n=1 Tax=Tumebacillus sp. BK434 TaxID=2512169 RepID=UPI0010D9A9A2|nr:helix-turn-helix transcriptional regulator [Tumebacillus sp. BK434]TCP53888.1 DNA-binding XRE family transcriptional regulator [Tumebacillus sp. BK434]
MRIDPNETLGERIRRLRLEKGMSQNDLADGFVTISMISQIENERRIPSVELAQHIARKLQVPLSDLMRHEVDQMETAWKHQVSKVYILTKQPAEAEQLLKDLLGLKDLSHAQQIEMTVDLAESLYLQNRYSEILELLIPLAEELESSTFDDVRTLARIHYTIGNAYYQKQNLTDANFHYRRADSLSLRFPLFDELAARISYNTGITLQLQGHHQSSAYYLERAYDFFSKTENMYETAAVIFAQGITYKNLREYELAHDTMSRALTMFEMLNLTHNSYIVKRTMASTLTVQENPKLAIEQLQDCIKPFEEQKNYNFLVIVLSEIAAIEISLGNLQSASKYLVDADITIQRQGLQSNREAGEYFKTVALYYLESELFSDAVENALISAEIFDKIGSVADHVDALQIACDAYHESGQDSQAYSIQRRCIELLKQLTGRSERIL